MYSVSFSHIPVIFNLPPGRNPSAKTWSDQLSSYILNPIQRKFQIQGVPKKVGFTAFITSSKSHFFLGHLVVKGGIVGNFKIRGKCAALKCRGELGWRAGTSHNNESLILNILNSINMNYCSVDLDHTSNCSVFYHFIALWLVSSSCKDLCNFLLPSCKFIISMKEDVMLVLMIIMLSVK